MRRIKDFRKRCEDANSPWKRVSVVYNFIKEDLSSDVSIELPEKARRSVFRKGIINRKTNARIVIDELHRYLKKYKDFYIFSTIADSPAISTENDLKKLFNIFIKELKRVNYGKMDRMSLKAAKCFSSIMDFDNFSKLYLMYRQSVKESTETINSLFKELSSTENEENNEKDEKKAEELRNQIYEERIKLGDDLFDPFFELLSDIFNHIREDEGTASNTKEEQIDEFFKLMYEDLPEFYEYICSFNGPIKLFFDDPNGEKTPKACLDLYDFLMEINILTFQNIEKREIVDFQNMVTGIKESFVPNLSWTNEEYQEFLKLCQKNDIDIPLAFIVIDSRKGSSKELDNILNAFLEEHKNEYMEWCIYGDKGYFDYKFQNKTLYTENDIKVYSIIVYELMKRQSNIKLIDIQSSKNGSTSSVIQIGDYIVKSGLGRYEKVIPNHRRILQPIIRQYNENAFLEVADVVDMNVTNNELKRVFYEFLYDGYGWVDPGKDNIGRLRRKNIPRQEIPKVELTEEGKTIVNSIEEMYSDEKATNMIGKVEGDTLDKGDCVVIDTDLVYDLRAISRAKFESIQFPPYMTAQMIRDLRARFNELNKEDNTQQIKQDIEGR